MPRPYVRAGEQWLLADNPDAAANGFRLAIADGGPVDVDPRVPLCRALFQLGDRDQAYSLIAELKSEGRADARACDMITELLVEQSDLPAALDWATAGVELILASQAGAEPGQAAQRVPGSGQAQAPVAPPTNGTAGTSVADDVMTASSGLGTCCGCVTGSAMTCGCRRTSTTACSAASRPASADSRGRASAMPVQSGVVARCRSNVAPLLLSAERRTDSNDGVALLLGQQQDSNVAVRDRC